MLFLKKTKKLSLLLFSPLAVYALDLFYGILNIDFGDTGRGSYGWLYLFFGIIINRILFALTMVYNYRTINLRNREITDVKTLRRLYWFSFIAVTIMIAPVIFPTILMTSIMTLMTIRMPMGQFFLATVAVLMTCSVRLNQLADDATEEEKKSCTRSAKKSLWFYLIPVLNIVVTLLSHEPVVFW